MLSGGAHPMPMDEFGIEDTDNGAYLGGRHHHLGEELQDNDGYGGMETTLYDAIVDFKKNGTYPDLDHNADRSANCHWRLRCNRFLLSTDGETLLYYNATSSVHDSPKIVVKKGEVKSVLERVHELIGHLGMKRTQFTVMRKLYWRSVRNDVRNYVNSCEFCLQKKLEGKKIIKAPIDIMSEDFDLQVTVRSNSDLGGGADRLGFSLNGVDEEAVRMAARQRMTSYTFRETAPEARQRFRPSMSSFKRQPYVKRSRFSPGQQGYLLPYASDSTEFGKKEPSFIELYHLPRDDDLLLQHGQGYEDSQLVVDEGSQEILEHNPEHVVEEEVITEEISADGEIFKRDKMIAVPRSPWANRFETVQICEIEQQNPRPGKVKVEARGEVEDFEVDERRRGGGKTVQRRGRMTGNRFSANVIGAGGRFANLLITPEKLISDAGELINSYDDAQRGELCPLAPIMFMPSTDQDVVMLQKELLERQRKIQILQERVLQEQYDNLIRSNVDQQDHQDVARYEVLDETTEVRSSHNVGNEDELNVMDGDDNRGGKHLGF